VENKVSWHFYICSCDSNLSKLLSFLTPENFVVRKIRLASAFVEQLLVPGLMAEIFEKKASDIDQRLLIQGS
jgi:hypothetical protein